MVRGVLRVGRVFGLAPWISTASVRYAAPGEAPAFPGYAVLLREVCAAKGVPLLDGVALLGDAPDPRNLYFAHDGHLNAAGHAHLAKALAKALPQALPALR